MKGNGYLVEPLVTSTPKGLYCEAGDFYVDPVRAVDQAVITHAHSDHARRGSLKYICEASGLGLLKARLGKKINAVGIKYGEPFQLGEVRVSFHSAGHILGSAQVRIQRGSQVWVVSGDYKREHDPSCEPFEVVKCDTFISEATFGTPKYVWSADPSHGQAISRWWSEVSSQGGNCVLFGYSLGKSQRILAELLPFASKPILVHSSIVELTECYRREGRLLAPTAELEPAVKRGPLVGELILAPPSILSEPWAGPDGALGRYSTAFASGWMQDPSRSRYDHGFVMSDHADWNALNLTIEQCGARRVFVQHRNGVLVRHLRKKGIDAHPIDALSPDQIHKLWSPNLSFFPDFP